MSLTTQMKGEGIDQPDVPVGPAIAIAAAAVPDTINPDRLYVLPVVLTVADMAKLLDRSERSIREEVNAGVFPIARLKHYAAVAWSRAAVLAWLGVQTWEPLRAPAQRAQDAEATS
jgi:predicted DNA-binding transcriptional regulator AlpA